MKYLKIDVWKYILAFRLLFCCISKSLPRFSKKHISPCVIPALSLFVVFSVSLENFLCLWSSFQSFLFGRSCLCRFGFHSAVRRRKATLLQYSGPRQSVAAVRFPHTFTHRNSDCPLPNLWLQTPLARSVYYSVWHHLNNACFQSMWELWWRFKVFPVDFRNIKELFPYNNPRPLSPFCGHVFVTAKERWCPGILGSLWRKMTLYKWNSLLFLFHFLSNVWPLLKPEVCKTLT